MCVCLSVWPRSSPERNEPWQTRYQKKAYNPRNVFDWHYSRSNERNALYEWKCKILVRHREFYWAPPTAGGKRLLRRILQEVPLQPNGRGERGSEGGTYFSQSLGRPQPFGCNRTYCWFKKPHSAYLMSLSSKLRLSPLVLLRDQWTSLLV